jgi:hypothetical protein
MEMFDDQSKQFVTPELAAKLLEKGYSCGDVSVECRTHQSNQNMYYMELPSNLPRIDDVLLWLRDKKGVFIEISMDCLGYKLKVKPYNTVLLNAINTKLFDYTIVYIKNFKEYRDAVLKGIETAIEEVI